jgi:hypothetical protein
MWSATALLWERMRLRSASISHALLLNMHHVSTTTLPATHEARPRLDPIQQTQSASG